MSDAPGPQLLAPGRLLIANPLLPDPNFDRTVVLLIAHGEEGAFGLVLNRPSEMEVAAPLPEWEHLAATPAVVFVGGPVQHNGVICLARTTPDGLGAPAWRSLTGQLGTIDLDIDPGGLSEGVEEVRVFAGYSGWSPGQLEGELEAGAWWVVDADASDPFSDHPDELWKRVLRRQKGSLRFVAYFPDDPMQN